SRAVRCCGASFSNVARRQALGILMLPLTRGVLDGENDDLVGGRIERVIDEVGIFPGDELAHPFHRLPPSDLGKQDEGLHGVEDRSAHEQRGGWIARADVVGDVDEVLCRARREAQLHRSKRRKAASTSASPANWRRLAWARPSSTAGRCAASISSGSPPLAASCSMARAISSWLSGSRRRTAFSRWSESLVIGERLNASCLV